MSVRGMFRPGMRGYVVPLTAGLALVLSVFLPWVVVGDIVLRGVPSVSALWVAGLGALATVLATLSLVTRKNSRHPLLVVGLAAFGILFLSLRIMPALAGERAMTVSEAFAIVEDRPVEPMPAARAGSGIYLGLAAAVALVGFGLTIVLRRASQPYAVATPDDDV
jgi:hypothetical protein